MILFFITPTGLITVASKVGGKAAEFLPVLGPAVKYTKKAKQVTQLTDSVSASSRGIGVMFDFCFGKAGTMSAECLLWLSLSTAGGLTGNPLLIAAGAEFGIMLLEEITD